MKTEWRTNPEFPKLEEYFVDGKMVAWLQPRPSYCDRGHWQVNVDVPNLDSQDFFPRHYMNYQIAKKETEAFIHWRLLKQDLPYARHIFPE